MLRSMAAEPGGLLSALARGMGARALKIGLGQAVIFGTYDAVARGLGGK